jgi:acyl-CoA synthetase (NDP forming)
VLFGNGGGTSVLAADAFGSRGLDVTPMPRPAIEALGMLELLPGTSVVNPIDAPAYTLRQDEGRIAERILDIVLQQGEPDAVVMHINLPVFIASTIQGVDVLQNLVDAAIRAISRHPGRAHFALVLRSDGAEPSERRRREFRSKVVAQGVPVYDGCPMRPTRWRASDSTNATWLAGLLLAQQLDRGIARVAHQLFRRRLSGLGPVTLHGGEQQPPVAHRLCAALGRG